MTETMTEKSAAGSGTPKEASVTGCSAHKETSANRIGFRVLYRKELADHLESTRLLIMLLLLLFVTFASFSGAMSNLSDAVKNSTEFNFLKIFTTAGNSTYSFVTFIGFLGPLFGIMLGFDAINNEQAQGTLNRLAAQPIYRDTIINAKFLAGATVILMTVFGLTGLMCGVGLIRTGIVPEPEAFARVLIFVLFSVIYISAWLAIAIFFSVVSRHAATAALASVAIWLFLTLFMNLVASGLAGLIYPLTGANANANALNNYALQIGWNRISPYYLYTEAISTILNPNIRSLNLVSILTQSQNNAIASYLTLGQSLMIIWPQIIALLATVAIAFAAAYVTFMKREIRA